MLAAWTVGESVVTGKSREESGVIRSRKTAHLVPVTDHLGDQAGVDRAELSRRPAVITAVHPCAEPHDKALFSSAATGSEDASERR